MLLDIAIATIVIMAIGTIYLGYKALTWAISFYGENTCDQ